MKTKSTNAATGTVKAPALLLGATLLFWGWQTGFLLAGALLAVILEGVRRVKTRWELSDDDFHRIWNFNTVLVVTAVVYAFSANEDPGGLAGLFQGPAMVVGAKVSFFGGRTALALLRWLPMLLYPLIAAQSFSSAGTVPLTAISLILRWRRRGEQRRGIPLTPVRRTDVSYPYFIVCLFSAGIHANQDDSTYFWGQGALLAWALWPLRSRRYPLVVWFATLALAISLAYIGQNSFGGLVQLVEGKAAPVIARLMRSRTDWRQSGTTLGRIGRMKLSGRIVIRLQPANGAAPPTYLREASYRSFRQQTWFGGRSRFDFERISPATNETAWILLPNQTNLTTVNIACYLNGTSPGSGNPLGLLPLPRSTARLDNLNAYLLQKNRLGAVLVEGPGLVIFDAAYTQGPGMDAPPDLRDFNIPTRELPVLDRVIDEEQLRGRDDRETLQRVSRMFLEKFTYRLWQAPGQSLATNETPLGRFLAGNRSGHCEYFATATTLLLRRLGIPARYAVGFAVHEPSGQGYVVRERDAHAWCEVWNSQAEAWEDFDTTPPSWIGIEAQRASSWQRYADLWDDVKFQFSKWRWSQTEWRRYILWGLTPVLVLLLYQVFFHRSRGRRRRSAAAPDADLYWPGLDSEFYKLEKQLAGRGVVRRTSEPLSDWLARALVDPALNDFRQPLEALLLLHYRYRFDPRGLDGAERRALQQEAKSCLDQLARLKQSAG